MFKVCISYICVYLAECLKGFFGSGCHKSLVCHIREGVMLQPPPWQQEPEMAAVSIMEDQETEQFEPGSSLEPP